MLEMDCRELSLNERWTQLRERLESTLSHHDDLLLEACQKGSHGNTVLHHLAMRQGPKDLVAHVLKGCSNARRFSPLLRFTPPLSSLSNHLSRLPLHYAAALSNDVDVVQMLIDDYPPGVLALDSFRRTPLSFALDTHVFRPQRPAIIKLLSEGARALKSEANQIVVKLCISRLKKEGMYGVVSVTPDNELSRPLFAFKVVEMMMASGMEPLAEYIVSLTGWPDEDPLMAGRDFRGDEGGMFGAVVGEQESFTWSGSGGGGGGEGVV